ncbi:MAG: hypothetical protein UIC65_05085 [Alphaproteobacteria bacterium]|nr:hypothetical protein [Alphaproteobacteria bacterium]
MKFIRILVFSLFFAPLASFAATDDFMMAAQLLAAAKNADIQQVQSLVNSGADVNFVDSTGLSIVCTALMNNDVRAAQILQMYGADASKCDTQIKKFNNRTRPKKTGGLFSGLSSAQSLTLTAAGAAVVVGGLFLLTDVFDPGNDNSSSSSGGNRPDNNPDGGGSSGTGTAAFVLPVGPAGETNYTTNLNVYSNTIYKPAFDMMSKVYGQNYLLMMHGYSPIARGYLGMNTLRNSLGEPISTSNIKWRGMEVSGGRPVNVALITANGINASNYAYEVEPVSSLSDILIPWTTENKETVNPADDTMVSSKYYNNKVVLGTGEQTLVDAITTEDSALLNVFDLSGWGTVVNNSNAANSDNLLAKVVGGRIEAEQVDFMGFMPNGQMTIFRTGNGTGMVAPSVEETGAFVTTDDKITQLSLYGETLTVVQNGNTFVAKNADESKTYNGYIGTNGNLYIDSLADGNINQMYKMSDDGTMTLKGVLGNVDYMNYKALYNSAALWTAGNSLTGGRTRPNVIANASVIEALHNPDVDTIDDVLSGGEISTAFVNSVNKYYNVADDGYLPGTDASNFFGALGASFLPITVFSVGATETDSNYSGAAKLATFENAVPLIYENAQNYFMSVVGVGLTNNGTASANDVSSFSPTGKYMLSQWQVGGDENAKYYKSRVCGVAGTGTSTVDPWCFAGAGNTDELAVASVAGAVGVLQSAFKLSNEQIFALLALTADGPYLATNSTGNAFTESELISHLESMYILPTEYQYRVNNKGENYLDVFKEVFGYGLINLERATKPGTSVYFFDGNKIVSANGNAYWRAASNTVFRPSAALNLRGASISAPFFDVLESVDGTLSLPRVWENEFAFYATDSRGLYMGDVLGDLKTVRDNSNTVKIGNLDFSMAVSERAYDDYMGGLDNLSLSFNSGNWNFGASYQRYLTDGVSRFSGMQNPIMGLTSNAIVSDAEYKYGNWAFGGRVFSGSITDEGLLENDPTISSQYMPAKLGLMTGADSYVAWYGNKFGLKTSFGLANESDTLLGAYTSGLLNLGAGETIYTDIEAEYNVNDKVNFAVRATFARTSSDVSGNFVLGLSDIKSNAFGLSANIGNLEFSISQPLAITDGALQYAYAKYDVDENSMLQIVDTHIADLALKSDVRETRFMGTYRHKFGEFTDGAFGFIYRVNPNHTSEFGNESIFMLKLSHRLGI